MACGSASVEEVMLLALSTHKVPIANCWRKDAARQAAINVTPPVIWRDLSTNDALTITKGIVESMRGDEPHNFHPAVRAALGACKKSNVA